MKIKFLTINIWNGGQLWNPLLKYLKKENPDILALQEVYGESNPKQSRSFRSVREFRKELKYEFNAYTPEVLTSSKNGTVESGNAIFSKFPVLENGNIFFDIPYKKFKYEGVKDFRLQPSSLQEATVLIDGKKVNIFNIHGIWDFHGEDNKRRLKMGDKIVSRIKNKNKVILAGDFNIKPDTETIGKIEKDLISVFKNELTSTFNMKIKGQGFETAAVDMIFVSRDIKVLDHYCPEVDVSDHMPLVAILEI